MNRIKEVLKEKAFHRLGLQKVGQKLQHRK